MTAVTTGNNDVIRVVQTDASGGKTVAVRCPVPHRLQTNSWYTMWAGEG